MNRRQFPFVAKAYGGYTRAQAEFFEQAVSEKSNPIVLDPMSGQGFALGELAIKGAEVFLCDINPAVLSLAEMRNPLYFSKQEHLTTFAKELVQRISFDAPPAGHIYHSEAIIPPPVEIQLQQFRNEVENSRFKLPNDSELSHDLVRKFLYNLPILAARSIACFRGSENVAWIKPGGLYQNWGIRDAIVDSIGLWDQFVDNSLRNNKQIKGSIVTQKHDISNGVPDLPCEVDFAICSPPYANRLDYARMWLPELSVYRSLWKQDFKEVEEKQVGTTIVRNALYQNNEDKILTEFSLGVLENIRRDSSKASANYYYPFFRNYAISLCLSLKNMVAPVRSGGEIFIFVRDTVRKDEIFPTGQIVFELLTQHLNCELIDRKKKVVRNHIGMRRGASTSIYGLGQQEWWLRFRKL